MLFFCFSLQISWQITIPFFTNYILFVNLPPAKNILAIDSYAGSADGVNISSCIASRTPRNRNMFTSIRSLVFYHDILVNRR
nr:MAG TPA: hypothetical protein [Caudoviricetes sp.]